MILVHALATAIVVVSGCGLLSLLRWPGMGSRSLSERIGLGYFVGLMLVTAEIFLLGHTGIPLTRETLLLGQVPAALLLLRPWLTRAGARGSVRPDASVRARSRLRWWHWILIGLLATKLVYVLVMNLTELRRVDDAFNWALSLCKHTFFEGTHVDFEMKRGYPRMPGLAMCWFALARGHWSEFSLNLAYFNYFAFFLLLFYANLRAHLEISASLMGTYVLSTFPLVLTHSVLIGYADLPLAIFVCFAGVYAYRYAGRGEWDDLVLAVFFTLSLPTIKLEGAVPFAWLGGYVMLVSVARRRAWLSASTVWVGTAALVAIGVVVLVATNARYGTEVPPFLTYDLWSRVRPAGVEHLAEVRHALFRHFGHYFNNWMMVGTLSALAVAPLAVSRRSRPEGVIGLYATLHLLAYLYLFCFGGAYEWLVQGTTVNRSFLQIAPLLLFTCTVLLGERADSVSRAEGGA